MTSIVVKPRELQKVADGLKSSATKMQNAVEGVHESFRSPTLSSIFEGNRAASVRARYSSARATIDAFDDLINQFAIELKGISNRFEIADRSKKKIIYLINGINYSGDPKSMRIFADGLEEQHGVEVRVVEAHPYDTRLIKGDIETRLGSWKIPTGDVINSSTDMKNSVYGVLQVLDEYRSGGGNESKKVFEWIHSDLNESGLINNQDVDVVLFGHSGGGVIAANIVDDIEGLGVNISGMVTAGSPVSNYDYAIQYADKIYDVQHQDDQLGKLFADWWWTGSGGHIRSDEARAMISDDGVSIARMWDITRQENEWEDQNTNITSVAISDGTNNNDAHGSYYHSRELINYFETILWGES